MGLDEKSYVFNVLFLSQFNLRKTLEWDEVHRLVHSLVGKWIMYYVDIVYKSKITIKVDALFYNLN